MVVVRASHANGIEGLKGLNYCHPGLHYEHTDRWTERFLKQFERSVTTPRCENATNTLVSQAEIEVAALADVFGAACRPGAWSNNPEEDKKLSSLFRMNIFFFFTFFLLKTIVLMFVKIIHFF